MGTTETRTEEDSALERHAEMVITPYALETILSEKYRKAKKETEDPDIMVAAMAAVEKGIIADIYAAAFGVTAFSALCRDADGEAEE